MMAKWRAAVNTKSRKRNQAAGVARELTLCGIPENQIAS